MRSYNTLSRSIMLLISCAVLSACGGESNSSSGVTPGGGDADMGMMNAVPVQGDLNLLNASARACDLLFQIDGHEATGVDFSSDVTGVFQKRSPKFAVSFTLKADQALTGSVGAIRLASGNLSDLQVVSATCFDGTGTKIEGDELVSVGAGN
jgi:hypothetical protein